MKTNKYVQTGMVILVYHVISLYQTELVLVIIVIPLSAIPRILGYEIRL